MRLRQKIILLIVPIIVLPMLVSGWVSYSQLKATAIEKSKEQMETLLEQYALYADSFVHSAESNVRLFSNNELLRRYMVTTSEEERYEVLQPLLMRQLQSYQKAYPHYYEFRVIFPDGFEDLRLVNRLIDNVSLFEADNPFIQTIMQKKQGVFSRMQRNEDNGELALYVAIALNLKDRAIESASAKPKFRGYLVITIDISEIVRQMELSTLGSDGFLFTTNAEGLTELFPHRLSKQLVGKRLSRDQMAGLSVDLGVQDVVGGVDLSQLPILSTHFLGNDGFMKGVKIHDDFILVTWLPFNEINEETRSLGLIVLVITLLAVAVTVVLLFSSLNYFVLRPIQQLRLAAIEIGRGNLSKDVDMNHADEVGDLAASFDEMRKNMLRSREHLEKQVDERTAEVREALQAAEKSSQAKSDFLSRMSHELRTPLNAVLGLSQLFEYDQNLAQHQKNNAREINNAGEHLLSLVDEVLDLSKIESGHLDLSIETLSLSRVLENSCILTASLAKAHDVYIQFEPGEYPDRCEGIYVRADYMRIKQVFLNLLSNAVKYNQEFGSVKISCSKADNNRVRISIKDTGPGISEEDMTHLFEPFNRLGAEYSETEGTGIGLMITRELVELMGGQLGVDSQPGRGSTFWVELITVAASEASDVARHLDTELEGQQVYEVSASDIRILVAEDNITNQEVLRQQLNYLGYKADFANDGVEALEQWQAADYHILLTDIHMPRMDGYELVASVRNSEKYAENSIPIIAVTADAMEGDVQRCLDEGLDDYIAKPVHLEVLQQVLGKWVSTISADDSVNHTTKQDADSRATIDNKADTDETQNDLATKNTEVINRCILTQLVGDDPEKHRHLLKTFVRTTPAILEDIQVAYAQRDADQLVANAHKLKSSARSMGAIELSELCMTMEKTASKHQWTVLNVIHDRIDHSYQDVVRYVETNFED